MQRVVSGEGIHGLSKYYRSSDQVDKEAPSDYLARNSENNEAMMSHSPSTAFDDAANFVENDGEGYFEDEDDGVVTMDMDDTFATFTSEPSIAVSQLAPQQQQEEIRHISQQHNSRSPSRSISSNSGGSNSNDKQQRTATTTEEQQQQHSPLSIISGLLPAVGFPLNDSRNSGATTSFGSGLQRSQNSSRDWGWFEDVHHSDQSATGSTISSGGAIGGTRTGGNNKSERTTIGGSVASSGANRTSLPQHQLTNTRTGDIVHGIGIGTSNNGNGSTITGGKNSSGNHHDTIEGGGDSANNNKNNWNNRLRPRGRGDNNTKIASLLPTGDEMLIDEMQEYLEPILIHRRPRDMENGKSVTASF
jgi:hypothetical protein